MQYFLAENFFWKSPNKNIYLHSVCLNLTDSFFDMKKPGFPVWLFALLSFGSLYAQDGNVLPAGIPTDGVHIRDPFVLADSSDGTYYMYGTTRGDGFDVFSSRDLETWQGPRAIFQRTPDFGAINVSGRPSAMLIRANIICSRRCAVRQTVCSERLFSLRTVRKALFASTARDA